MGSGNRRADLQRLEGIAKMQRPYNKKLRKILGVMGFYREYIPQFAHIAKPLTDLTAKHSPNVLPWRDEHQVAFESLRDRLSSAHVLRIRKLVNHSVCIPMLVNMQWLQPWDS